MTLKIEEGKFYRTRDGRKVGPMKPSLVGIWPWIVAVGDGKCWNHDGSEVKNTGSGDLIAEWIDAEQGKAADLDLQPGDVVECVDDGGQWYWTEGKRHTITSARGIVDDDGDDIWNPERGYPWAPTFRIVSRAADKAETPTLLRDMTDAEVGALWRADQRGEVIEFFYKGKWHDCMCKPAWNKDTAYRIKPAEPETVTLYGIESDHDAGWLTECTADDTHSITMPRDLKPGTYTGPDGDVITVEELGQ